MQSLLPCCGNKVTLRPPRLVDEQAPRRSLQGSISETCFPEGATWPDRLHSSPCAHESGSDSSEPEEESREQPVSAALRVERGLHVVEGGVPLDAQVRTLEAQVRALEVKATDLRAKEADLCARDVELRLKDAMLRPVQQTSFGIPPGVVSGGGNRRLPIDDDLRDLQECLRLLATLKTQDLWRRMEDAGCSGAGSLELRTRGGGSRRLLPEVKQQMLGKAKELVPALHAAAASAQSAVEVLAQEVPQPGTQRLRFQTASFGYSPSSA